ncbi:MAG: hypothetical protein CMP06_05890 [Xanthomonadales bacterium]|nr:hypothetical protein [Xanthomonadales bacterium]
MMTMVVRMQMSFSDAEYGAKPRQTRRDRFLARIEAATPWALLVSVIEPHYPKGGGRGRPPIGCERMLRMYIAQQCFGLSDEGIEDALYDSQAIRRFVGVDLSREAVLDATTAPQFGGDWKPSDPGDLTRPSTAIWPRKARCSEKARSWTPASFRRRPRPRTRPMNGNRRCTRRRRTTSGSLA